MTTQKSIILAALLLAVLASSSFAADPIRPLGTITITNGIRWDHPVTNLYGFNVYLGEIATSKITVISGATMITNMVIYGTNFTNVATVLTNHWTGNQARKWNGEKALYVTALNDLQFESEPSEIVRVTFRAGIPVQPSNIQIFSVVTASATNALPPLPN